MDSGARGDLASISRAVDDILDVDLGLDGVDYELRRGIGLGLVGSQVLAGDGERVDALAREGHRSGVGIAVAGPAADLGRSSLVAVTGRDGSLNLEQVRIEVVLLNRNGSRTSSVVILTVLSSLSVPRHIQLRSSLIDGEGIAIGFRGAPDKVSYHAIRNDVVAVLGKRNRARVNIGAFARLLEIGGEDRFPRLAVSGNGSNRNVLHVLLNVLIERSFNRQGQGATNVVVLTIRSRRCVPRRRDLRSARSPNEFSVLRIDLCVSESLIVGVTGIVDHLDMNAVSRHLRIFVDFESVFAIILSLGRSSLLATLLNLIVSLDVRNS